MQRIGIQDAFMDEYGYVYGTIPANCEKKNTIGFIAHMDTAPDFSGKGVKPRIIEQYDGGDIVLNETLGIVTSVSDFPAIQNRRGKTLIVTDGTTLLGGDDKAGIAEILQMAEEVLQNNLPHGTVKSRSRRTRRSAKGPVKFDVEGFGCDFAYTVDGGDLGELEYENFNGASAHVAVKGLSVHPGSAKNKMINAMTVAMEFAALLPKHEVPENTEGYEGFAHLVGMQGEIENAVLDYIIRDHDRTLLKTQGKVPPCRGFSEPQVRPYTRHRRAHGHVLQHEGKNPAAHGDHRDGEGRHAAKRRGAEDHPDPRRHRRRAALLHGPAPARTCAPAGENAHSKHELVVLEDMGKDRGNPENHRRDRRMIGKEPSYAAFWHSRHKLDHRTATLRARSTAGSGSHGRLLAHARKGP